MIGDMTSAATTEQTWTIAQVADEFGVTHRTVRHYEDLGLISPERRGTQRVYHRRDRTRLNLILRGKRLGFPLEEIRTIIDRFDAPRGRRTQLEYVLGQIDERRSDLAQRLRDDKRTRWGAPTVKELGVDTVSSSPFGLVGPKGMSPQVVKVLHDAFKKSLDDPEYLKLLAQLDQPAWYQASADYAKYAAETFKAERATIERVGLLLK